MANSLSVPEALHMALGYLEKVEVKGKNNLDFLLGSIQMLETCIKVLSEQTESNEKAGDEG